MRHLILLALAAACAAAEPAPVHPLADIVTSKGTIRVALFADEAPMTVETFLGLAAGTREFTDPATKAAVKRPFYDGLTFHRVIKGFMIQGGDPLGSGAGGPGFAFADEINARSLGLEQETVLTAGDQPNPACGYMMEQFQQVCVMPALVARRIGAQTPRAEQLAALDAIMPELRRITLRQFYEKLGYKYDDALPASHRPLKGSLAMANSGPGTNGSQFFINLGDTPHLAGKHTVFGEVVGGQDVVEAIGNVPVGPGDRPVEPVTILSVRAVKAEAPAPAKP
jgi:peptidyl-prolyl cis-trans isomerase A (cyclophilin A)